jgi:protein-disulfide isomerase
VQQQAAEQPTAGAKTISTEGRPVKGDAKAKVTIVEYSDFQCPYCQRFNADSMKQVMTEYVATGKVKVVFKHFPLPFHENAQKAAEATECAFAQGKFWEMHDKIFDTGTAGGDISVTGLKQMAAALKLDTAKFNTCLDSGEKAAVVAQNAQEGQNDGVSGTPTSFINGKEVVGAQPYSAVKAAIEAALAG